MDIDQRMVYSMRTGHGSALFLCNHANIIYF